MVPNYLNLVYHELAHAAAAADNGRWVDAEIAAKRASLVLECQRMGIPVGDTIIAINLIAPDNLPSLLKSEGGS